LRATGGRQWLVERGVEIISEASRHLPSGSKARHPEIPWPKVAGIANSASNWGLIGLVKSAALELGEHRLTVNAVIPGLTDTPLTRHRQRYAQAVGDLAS
jgi:NAD(P)-dependent dehydrogenase (short-subunit alcohol dehydrogenase family)